MGTLRNPRNGRTVPLGARALVGRAPAANLRIEDACVSGEHATLWWSEGRWWLRDLGSTNGTFVGVERLAPGQAHPLAPGSRCSFGAPDRPWDWVEDGPPRVVALRGDRVVAGHPTLLSLPSDDDPQATVFLGPDGWMVESRDGTEVMPDHGAVVVSGAAWTVLLPEVLQGTERPDGAAWVLHGTSLRLAVSRDEEAVHATLLDGSRVLDLGVRAHHYLLLYLARRRAEDSAARPDEQGWVHTDVVQRELALNELALNVQVHRCRKGLAALGVEGSAGVIERRRGTGQLRLGLGAFSIEAS